MNPGWGSGGSFKYSKSLSCLRKDKLQDDGLIDEQGKQLCTFFYLTVLIILIIDTYRVH